MTDPKEAKHLNEKQLDEFWEAMNKPSIYNDRDLKRVFDQAKAYNTVKAELDKLHALIEEELENSILKTEALLQDKG